MNFLRSNGALARSVVCELSWRSQSKHQRRLPCSSNVSVEAVQKILRWKSGMMQTYDRGVSWPQNKKIGESAVGGSVG